MLKVKEMVRAPAEAYPSLEVMHGPNYLLSKKTLVRPHYLIHRGLVARDAVDTVSD